MFNTNRNASIGLAWWIGIACVGGIGVATWGFVHTDCSVSVSEEHRFNLDTDMDTFRQILVRTKATAAVLEHSGMKLLEESTDSVNIDLKKDARPLRNFLRGKSKANVSAIKHLRVQLNDPEIRASELSLTQECLLQPENIHIETTADRPSGAIKRYQTVLNAVRGESGTDITLNIDMTVDIQVSRIFHSQSEARMKQAATKILKDQEAALISLVSSKDTKVTVELAKAER